MGRRGSHAVDDPLDVDGEHAVQGRFLERKQAPGFEDAGVVDEDVERAEGLERAPHHRLDLAPNGHVGG